MIIMDAKTSVEERRRQSPQRAMRVDEFCRRYGVGRTTAYQQIKQKRLRARKIGKRTLIAEDDAETWLRQLPVLYVEHE
jgi:excisionase family DNA binding protein